MLTLLAVFRITRLENSLLGFIAIFLPVLIRTGDIILSFGRALPLLFICMCTFIANDLDDVDRDRINHPERPLPSGRLTPVFATILYFTFLGLALFTARHFVEPGIDFWYYALITLSISYGYVVEYLPVVKNVYVAVLSSVPILIVAALYPNETRLYFVAISMALVTLGREICGDIQDRAGDNISFINRFDPGSLAILAFSVQAIGLLLLVLQLRSVADIGVLSGILLLASISGLLWFKYSLLRSSSNLMKIEYFLGLYFLF